VHRPCQEDWLQHHCYPLTPEDQLFCQEHTGELPYLQNGCVEESFLNPR